MTQFRHVRFEQVIFSKISLWNQNEVSVLVLLYVCLTVKMFLQALTVFAGVEVCAGSMKPEPPSTH